MLASLNSLNSLLQSSKFSKSVSTSPNGAQSNTGVAKTGRQDSFTRNADSFKIFNDVLQKAYQKLVFNPEGLKENSSVVAQKDIAAYQRVDKITSQQAANTILTFINLRIQSDAVEGAGTEALLERLEQGLDGFIRGFNEAQQIIDDLGLLTPKLLDEINGTFTLVTQGIEQIRDGLLADEQSIS